MKKIILLAALMVAAFSFGQETEGTIPEDRTATVYLFAGGMPAQIGVYFEASSEILGNTRFWFGSIAAGSLTYEDGPFEADMNGYVAEIGIKSFFNKQNPWKGLYYSNSISNGKFKYDEDGANAEYQYWSFVNPEFGYKLMLGPVAVVPYLGATWKIEVEGKGGVDNKNVDNWVPRMGLRLGYSF